MKADDDTDWFASTSPESRHFWRACANGRLELQRCENCSALRYPPSGNCPECLSAESNWTQVSGTGSIYSYVIYHHSFRPELDADVPYVVALVELDAGIKMVSRLTNCIPQALTIGTRVEAHFCTLSSGITVPFFRPSS